MKTNLKQPLLLITFGVALFAGLMNLSTVLAFLKNIINLILPVVLGFVLAFILNVPMRGFENLFRKLGEKRGRPFRDKPVQMISLFLTLICVLLAIALVFTLVIPELANSVLSLYELVIEKWPEWVGTLNSYHINTQWLTEWLTSLNLVSLIEQLSSGAGTLLSSAVDIVSTTVSGIATFGIAIIIAIYALVSKYDLRRQVKKLAAAHMRDKFTGFLFHAAELLSRTYSKFLSGQCLEACILGSMIFVSFSIFHIPYASLIGVLTAVLAFIPYIGSFAACAIGAFLVLLSVPSKTILCIVVYLVVQFVENQFIYPHVVGTSVGLSPLWTLISVVVGGKLMGVFGMIFFIPLTAVIITLLREHTDKVLASRNPVPEAPEPASEPKAPPSE